MLAEITQWLQSHMVPCFYKQAFGISCPMCGFQRSVIELIKGNYVESIIQFPALIPLLLTVLVFSFLKIAKIGRVKIVVQTMLIFDLTIMILACAYKNIY